MKRENLIHWLVNLVTIPIAEEKLIIQVGYLRHHNRNKLFLIRGDIIYSAALPQNSHVCIPFLGIARPQSQFPHSCVMSDLYILRSVHTLHIFSCSRIGWKLGLWPRNSFSGNIGFEYCVFAVWNPTLYNRVFILFSAYREHIRYSICSSM